MKFHKYLVLVLILPFFAFTIHKYYISLCEIEYVESQHSLQITIGMFIDDLEVTLNKNHQLKLEINTDQENEKIDKFYASYLTDNFKIVLNDIVQKHNYIGKEYDDDIVRFYLEIVDIKALNSLEITNTSLFKDFEDQQNIIKIKVNDFHKTFYLNKKNDKGLLKF